MEDLMKKLYTDNEKVVKHARDMHNKWVNEMRLKGYHKPIDCESDNAKDYFNSTWESQERFSFSIDTYHWCNKCNKNLIDFENLQSDIKELYVDLFKLLDKRENEPNLII